MPSWRLSPSAESAVIDLSHVTFIDSAILSALVASRRRGEDGDGARLALVAPPGGFPARVLGLLQLGQVMGVYASRDEALASF
jgi:anti-anti-sigma regulatory factor